jgi:hypothetical protein
MSNNKPFKVGDKIIRKGTITKLLGDNGQVHINYLDGMNIIVHSANPALFHDDDELQPVTPKAFKYVKHGDWIFTIRAGWVKVSNLNIHCSADYPVGTSHGSYTLNGKEYSNNTCPSAWTYDPFNGTEPPFMPKLYQVIAVWNMNSSIQYKMFSEMEGRRYCTYGNSVWDHARQLTAEELGI